VHLDAVESNPGLPGISPFAYDTICRNHLRLVETRRRPNWGNSASDTEQIKSEKRDWRKSESKNE
jgi:hypothetical protein